MTFRLSHLAAAPRSLSSAQRLSALSSGAQYSLAFARWHVGHHHSTLPIKRTPRQESDVALAVGKALTGYVPGSTVIIADAAHSVSDIVSLNLLYVSSPKFYII
jgi:hypothetical protein